MGGGGSEGFGRDVVQSKVDDAVMKVVVVRVEDKVPLSRLNSELSFTVLRCAEVLVWMVLLVTLNSLSNAGSEATRQSLINAQKQVFAQLHKQVEELVTGKPYIELLLKKED